MFKSRRLLRRESMRSLSSKIIPTIVANKFSIEEAILKIIKDNFDKFKDSLNNRREIVDVYGTIKDGTFFVQEPKVNYKFNIKNKKNYNIFMKFYKEAKSDIKKNGAITLGTLMIIKSGKKENIKTLIIKCPKCKTPIKEFYPIPPKKELEKMSFFCHTHHKDIGKIEFNSKGKILKKK